MEFKVGDSCYFIKNGLLFFDGTDYFKGIILYEDNYNFYVRLNKKENCEYGMTKNTEIRTIKTIKLVLTEKIKFQTECNIV